MFSVDKYDVIYVTTTNEELFHEIKMAYDYMSFAKSVRSTCVSMHAFKECKPNKSSEQFNLLYDRIIELDRNASHDLIIEYSE